MKPFTHGLYISHLTMLVLYSQSGRPWNTTGVADLSHAEALLVEMGLDIPIEYQE